MNSWSWFTFGVILTEKQQKGWFDPMPVTQGQVFVAQHAPAEQELCWRDLKSQTYLCEPKHINIHLQNEQKDDLDVTRSHL